MANMKVNFNGVRRQALFAYERLCGKLNGAIENGMIEINVLEIQKDMDDLKTNLGVIAMTFDPDIEGFDDVFSSVYDEDERMTQFNQK